MSKALVIAVVKAIEGKHLSEEEKELCNEFSSEFKEYDRIANDKKRIEAGWQKVKQKLSCKGLL